MANILAIGIATLDIINVVESYPTEDSELRALSQQQLRGGNATNTLTVLSQLGHHCSWGGILIDEPDSQIIKDDLAKSNIDISSCKQLASGKMPTSYITLNKKTGSRSIVHHRDCPEFSFLDFQKIKLDDVDWVHFEGRNIAETQLMLQHLKQHYPHLPCSLEIEKPRPDIEQLFELPDVLLFSQHYVESLGFNTASDFLTSLKHDKLIICAWGNQGAWALDLDKNIVHSSAFPPSQLIDTLGAGDTFNAGLIHSLVMDIEPQKALENACQLAGHKCGQYGFVNLTTHFKLQS
ncbi:MAG: ketohexokinase [Methylophaga sp.]|nr:ketohexokinase [Methylophaga sp.]